jgi:hypothetical protein
MFTILQDACSHFLKLNDFLRTDAFIENIFRTYPNQSLQIKNDFLQSEIPASMSKPKESSIDLLKD